MEGMDGCGTILLLHRINLFIDHFEINQQTLSRFVKDEKMHVPKTNLYIIIMLLLSFLNCSQLHAPKRNCTFCFLVDTVLHYVFFF